MPTCHSIQPETEQEPRNVQRPSYGSKGAAIMAVPCQRCGMSQEQKQDSSPLVPIEQQTILFYGKPLVVVRLLDRRPAIVLRQICDNLQLEPTSQMRRIKRTGRSPMIWCISRSRPMEGHKSCRCWCCAPLHLACWH